VSDISSSAINSGVAINPLNTNADKLLHGNPSATSENAKIEKSATDFESILLSSWLQQAEQSFGSVPGGDDEDTDSGKDQYMGIAMQSLGTSMTASGGIGIAKMISKSLHKAEDARVAKTQTIPVK
jgi:Rod binding domain-containing protein